MERWDKEQKRSLGWGPASPSALVFGSAQVFKHSPLGMMVSILTTTIKPWKLSFVTIYTKGAQRGWRWLWCSTAEICICTKCWKNTPISHAGVAGLLVPRTAVCTSSVIFLNSKLCGADVSHGQDPQDLGSCWSWCWPWPGLVSWSVPELGSPLPSQYWLFSLCLMPCGLQRRISCRAPDKPGSSQAADKRFFSSSIPQSTDCRSIAAWPKVNLFVTNLRQGSSHTMGRFGKVPCTEN